MTHPQLAPKKSRRLFSWFVGFVILLFVGGAALWFYAAAQLEEFAETARSNLAQQKKMLTCSNQTVRGFPFRLGLFCDDFAYREDGRSLSISTGAVRSAAQIYAPGKVVSEIESPATVKLPDLPEVRLDWESLRSSMNANLDGILRGSLVISHLKASSAHQPRNTDARTVEAHFRKSGENDLEAALGAVALKLPQPDGTQYRPFDFSLEVLAENLFDELRDPARIGAYIRNNGLAGTLKSVRLAPIEGGEILASGPFQVNIDGLITAKLKLRFRELGLFLEYLRQFLPNERREFDQIAGALQAIPKPASDEYREVSITIVENNASWGFVPLGKLPKLF